MVGNDGMVGNAPPNCSRRSKRAAPCGEEGCVNVRIPAPADIKGMMELTVFVENTVLHFSRYHKYTLGSELRGMCHQGLGLVVDANSTEACKDISDRHPIELPRGREAMLHALRGLLERIKIHLVIAKEVGAFNNKNSFVQASEMVVDLCRQNEGWIKSTAGARAGRLPASGKKTVRRLPPSITQGKSTRGPESPS